MRNSARFAGRLLLWSSQLRRPSTVRVRPITSPVQPLLNSIELLALRFGAFRAPAFMRTALSARDSGSHSPHDFC